jgi:hypothetical protein
MDSLRRAIRGRAARTGPIPIPLAALADQLEGTSLAPLIAPAAVPGLLPSFLPSFLPSPLPIILPRPVLRVPELLERGRCIPPIVGELGYFDFHAYRSAWRVNGTNKLCHFSAPRWYYPGAGPDFLGVITSVDSKVVDGGTVPIPGRASPPHPGPPPTAAVPHVGLSGSFSADCTDADTADSEPFDPEVDGLDARTHGHG